MVFTYWRYQHTDVLGNYLSFEEHTMQARRDEINEQVQEYAVCSEDLNEIGHHLQECDEHAFDTKALTLI